MKKYLLVIIFISTAFLNIKGFSQTLSVSATSYCTGGAGVTFSVNNSVSGTTYYLEKLSGTWSTVDEILSISGGTVYFPTVFFAGTYRLKTTIPTIVVTATVLPEILYNVTINISTGAKLTADGAGYCSGTSAYPSIGLSGSQVATTGVIYKLYKDDAWYNTMQLAGTGAAISFGPIPDAGTYTVRAERNGCPRMMTGSKVITVFPLPSVSFTPTYLGPPNQCGTVTFLPNISYSPAYSGSPFLYNWSFGATSIPPSSISANPTSQFPGYGINTQPFDVSLQLTDKNGCAGTSFGAVTVQQRPDATVVSSNGIWNNCSASPSASYTIIIINKSTTAATNTGYIIDWDDSPTPLENLTPAQFPFNGEKTHTYNSKGTFHLTITAIGPTSPGCNDTKIFPVFNGSTPTGGLTYSSGILEGCQPHTITFFLAGDAQDNAPTTYYYFDFGDGTSPLTFTQENMPAINADGRYHITHTYNSVSCGSPGSAFKLTHYIQNPCATIPNDIGGIKISKKSASAFLSAEFPAEPIYVCSGVPRIYTNNTSDGCIIYGGTTINATNYYWDFNNDGIYEITGVNPSYSFATPGTYSVFLKSITGESLPTNCGDSIVMRTVCVQAPPVSEFSIPASLCTDTPFAPVNTSVSEPGCANPQYQWTVTPNSGFTYTGTTNSGSFQPTFNFTVPGVYTVKLDVIVNSGFAPCNMDSYEQIITIKSSPTITINQPPFMLQCGPGTIDLSTVISYNANQATISTYAWSISPAGATISDPSIAYPLITIVDDATRTYTLNVLTTNECGNTASGLVTISVTKTITDNVINYAGNTDLCNGMTLTSSITGNVPSGGDGAFAYQWYIFNGTWSPIASATSKDLNYTPALVSNPTEFKRKATSGSCVLESDPLIFTVFSGIQNNVISQPQSICSGSTPVTITGSAPTQGNGGYTYLWQQSTDSPSFSTWNTAPGTNDLIDYSPGALTQTTRYRRIVYSGVCDLPSNVIEKTVYPIPAINSLPASTICSGVALNYAITSSAPGTSYTWIVTDLSGGLITGATNYAGGPLTTIPDLLTNSAAIPKTIQYTITPKGPTPTFCPGADFPVIVTVRPKFNSTYNDQSINSGTSTTLTGLISGGTPGTGYSYSWTPSNKIATGQSTLPNPLTTILTAPQSYTLLVTDAALCQFTQVITISTSGIPLNAVITSSDFDNTLCEGSSITLTATATGGGGNGIPANYTYIWNGLPGGVSYIHPWEVQFIPSNIGSNIYTVDVGDGFTTTTASKTLTVSKIPSVTSVLEKQICSGGDVAYTPLSDVPGTTFNWVRGFNTYITSLPPDNNGSGTINNVLANSNNTVETIKYTIIPTGPAPTYCVGSSAELIVSVKPVASITNPGNSQIVVSGYPSSSVTFTSNVAAAGIHWKYSATTSSCPGLISFAQYQGYTPTLPVQTITLLPGAPATCILSYLVRPYLIITVGDTCWGNQFTYNFIVNSEPAKYDMICPLPICAGQTATVSLSNSDIGIEYRLYRGVTWIPPMLDGQNAQLDWTGINVSGNYSVKATNTTNGQTTLMNGMCQVIINPNPIPNYVIGSTGHCSGDIITLNGSETGVDYELYILGSPIEMHTGTGGILNFTNTSIAGTYTIKATNNTTGCWNWIDGSVVIYENPTPFLFSPGGILCVGDELWLENSETGTAYQLWCTPLAGGPDVLVSTAPGTSFPLSFGLQSIAGTYYVHAINLVTNCDVYFADRKTFRLNPQLFNITPQAAAIPNCGLTLIGLDDSEIGIVYDVYQLDALGFPLGFPFPGLSSVTGTGSSIVFGSTNVVGEYVVIGRYSDGICSSQMNGSVVISSKPTQYQMDPTGPRCIDQTTGIEVKLLNSDNGVNYTLSNGSNSWTVAGGANPLSFGNITLAGTYSITANNPGTNCSEVMLGSLTLTINPNRYTLYPVSPDNNFCPGQYDIWIGGSQSGVSYTLHTPNTPLIVKVGTGGSLNWGKFYYPGDYTVTAQFASGQTCPMNLGTVHIYSKPGVYTITVPSGSCENALIGLSGSDANTAYELLNYPALTATGATHIGGTGSFNFSMLQPAGSYVVRAVNLNNCDTIMTGIAVVDPLPTVDAGPAVIFSCITPDFVVLNGTAAHFSSVLWNSTTDPTGLNFSPNNNLSTTYTFTATDKTNHVASITLKAFGTAGCISSQVSDNIIVNILVPEVNAGPDQVACANQEVQLAGIVSGGASAGMWVGGSGTFDPDRAAPNAKYTPSSIEAGTTVILTFRTTNASPCDEISDQMEITVFPEFVPGIAGSNQTICTGESRVLTGTVPSGGSGTANFTYQWQFFDGTSWVAVSAGSGGTTLVYTTGLLSATTRFRLRQTDSYCIPVQVRYTNEVTITVNNLNAGTISADVTICENQATSLTGNVPTIADGTISYQWQSSPDGIVFTDISLATAQNYTTSLLTSDTWFRRITTSTLNSVLCSSTSNTVKVTVNNLNAGSISANSTICENQPAVLSGTVPTVADGIVSYQWQTSSDGITFADIPLATLQNYSTTPLTSDTWFRRIATSSLNTVLCSSTSNVVKVTVNNLNAGSISADITICENQTAALTGTVPGLSDGTISYQWQSGPDGITFTDISLATTQNYTTTPLSSDTWFRRIATSTLNSVLCSGTSNSVKVTVNNLTAGTISADVTICENQAASISCTVPTLADGTIGYQWQSSPDGITFTDIPLATTQNYTTMALTADRWFRRIATSTLNSVSCNSASAIVKVTVNNLNAGTIGSDITICENQTTTLTGSVPTLFDGTISYQWQSSPDGISFTDILLATSQNYTTTPLAADTWYRRFAISNLNLVACSSTSNTVKVTVNNLNAGTISADVTICENQSVALSGTIPSIADGTISYQWQSSPDGIVFTDISLATAQNYTTSLLISDTWFRRTATSTLNSVLCSSNSNTVKVTVNNLNAGTILANSTICENQSAVLSGSVPTVADGIVSYQWQSSSDGITFADIPLATLQNYSTTPLTADTWFRRIATSSLNAVLCSIISNSVKVTVNNLNAGTISSDITICENQTDALTGTVPSLSDGTISYQWQSGPDGITFTDISLATTQNYTTTPLSSDTWFRRIATSTLNSVLCSGTSNSVKVTVNNLTAGTISADVTICENQAASLTCTVPTLADGTIGYQWQSSPDGITFTDIPLATTQNYTTVALTADRWFRRIATSTLNSVPCTSVSASVKVTVNNLNAGTIASDITICENQTTTLTGSVPTIYDGTISYQWQSSPDGIIFTDILLATSQNYTTTPLAADTWYRRFAISNLNLVACSSTSNTVKVTVNNLAAGTISADVTICENQSVALSGTVPSIADGTISYQWQSSPDGIVFTNISLATLQNYNTTALIADTWYRRIATSTLNLVTCSNTSNTVKVTVNNLTAGTIGADITICENQTTALSGSAPPVIDGSISYQWQSSPDGILFSDISLATSQNYTTIPLSSDTWFRRIATSSLNTVLCSSTSNIVKVTVNNLNAGTISSDITVCENQVAVLTGTVPTLSDGTISYQWQSSPDGIAFTNIALATLQNYTSMALTADTWFRRIATSTLNLVPCSGFSNTVKVTVNNLNAGVISSDITICENQSASLTCTVPSIADGSISYQWQSSSDGIIFSDISLATFQNYITIPLVADKWFRRITTSTLNYIVCTSISTVVKVTVNNLTAGTISADMTLCEDQIAALTGTVPGIVDGTISYQWQSSPDGILFTNISLANLQNYTSAPLTADTWYRRIATSSLNAILCSSTSNTVKVTVNNLTAGTISPDMTICENQTATLTGSLPAILDGTISYQWQSSPDGIAFTDIYLATSQNYTSTPLSVNTWFRRIAISTLNSVLCSSTSTITKVTVNPLPVPTIQSGQTPACINTPFIYTTQAGMNNYDWVISPSGMYAFNYPNPADKSVIQITWTATGLKTVAVNYKNQFGCLAAAPSPAYSVDVVPAPVYQINGPALVCENATVTYQTTALMTNYQWEVTGGTIISGGTTADYEVTVHWTTFGAKTIRVNYIGLAGCFALEPAILNVVVVPAPTPTIINNAPTSVCIGDAGVVYTTQSGMTAYAWTATGGTITGGQGSNSVLITWNTAGPGSVTVSYSYSNTFGCAAVTPTVYPVTVNPLPVPSLTGNAVVCSGSEYIYTSDLAMNNYLWTVSSGGTITAGGTPTSNTATVLWNSPGVRSVTVTYTNSNGCIAAIPAALAVNVKALPIPHIYGNLTPCPTVEYGYSTEQGMTQYTWSISAGGTIQYGTNPFAVTANWSTPGANSISVVVKDNDGCVSAAPPPETLIVDVLPLPAEPVISGSNTACENSSGNVYTTETGKSNYVWSIPAGGTITGGAGTSSISVSWGSPGIRTVTVQYINSNSCTSAPMTVPFTVTVAPRPVPTFPVAAGINNPAPCLNQTGLVYSTQAGMSNYIWTVTSGGIITAGGNTGDPSVTVTWNSVGPQNVTVSYTDPATGCSAAGSTVFPVDVKPLPIPTITSTASIVCVNASGNIYTTQTGKTDYNWTIPDGSGTIIAGQGTYLVTVSWTLPGIHSICVTYKDNNLCEAAAPGGCYTVTVNALPVPTISGAGTSCRSESKVYTTEGGMTGYQWVAAPNGEIISGNGTNSIIVKWKISGINAVTVNYSNSYGCTAVTATAYNVTVYEQPVSKFAANSVCFGNLTNFIDQSVPNSGTINLWNWDFGDPTSAGNNTSANQNPSHLFTSWGSYNVKLVVTNSNGCVHDTTISVTVNPNPLANFATIAANNCLNTPTKFNDLSALPQGQINKWKWDFGVATLLNDTSISQNPSYQYNLPGIYHVKLKVTSVFGCSDSIVLPVQIFKPPTANFRFTSIPCENGKVSFQDSSFAFQTSIVAWNWEFEPYQNSIAQNPVHVFYDMDSCYNVSLIAKDFRGCFDTVVKQVCVPSALKIGFTSSETCLGDSTRFIPHLVAPLNDSLIFFNWNFNDQGSGTNNTSTKKFPSHYFSLPGTYQVSLSATDRYNCTVPNPVYINVVVKPLPTATFAYHEGVCDSLVTFNKPVSGGGITIVSWLWAFGDGDSIHFQNTHPATLVHKYPGAGFYTVKLTVKNSDSCSNTITTPNVWVKPCLVASVSLSDTLTCQNQTFAFADNSVSGIPVSLWKWNFGDGDSLLYTSYRDTVYHTFQLPGNYTVKMRISGSVSGNPVADTSQVTVKVRQTPLADFVIPDNKFCFGGKASFNNTSNGNGSEINSWKWDFGDSASTSDVSTLRDPDDYQYIHYGSFSVRLITKNTFGCADTNFKPVTVFQLPESGFESMNACVSQLTVFNDQTIGYDTTIATWNWSISDSVNGFVNYQTTQNATYTFDKLGIYLVSLKTVDANGCRDSLEQRVTIYNKPFSAFTFTENIDNVQGQVQFNNGSSGATAYLWDFGNGQKNTHETPPVITYSQNGEYHIRLIASENSTTCADTAYFTYNFVLKGLYIPNAFSPNNPKEGVRLLKPVGMGISEYLFEVFDRWGNPVYRSDSLDAEGRPVGGWDGTLNGVEMPIGAYVWKASAVFLDGTIWNADDVGVQEDRFKYKFGTATLIR